MSFTFRNDWKVEPAHQVDTTHVLSLKPEEYDLNFCLPKAARVIENDLIQLVPYIPSLHARELFDAMAPYPEMFRYYPVGPYLSLEEMVILFELYRSWAHTLVYVVYDKRNSSSGESSSGYRIAGTIGFLWANPARFSIEIGHLMTLPSSQGTHVTRNAVGLLLLVFSGATPLPGLRLRRVEYRSDPDNVASVKVAQRFGFKVDGEMRWTRPVPSHKSDQHRSGDSAEVAGGLNTILLSICFDDWDREGITKIMTTGRNF
ncbi:acyl-CoA N-acyltransferase [Clavulina sp. PMI_390]|nr:acyl-CoA N-acyltransferase [Clavulina sp. PMI_390]